MKFKRWLIGGLLLVIGGITVIVAQPRKVDPCATFLERAKSELTQMDNSYWVKSAGSHHENVTKNMFDYLVCRSEQDAR